MTSPLDPVINYCERTGPGLFAEPLNAISNLSFFIVAWALFKLYKSTGGNNREAAVLIYLVFLVACGSTLFHTFANQLAMIGDVAPIAMFTFFYLWVALRRFMKMDRTDALIALFVFTIAAALTPHAPEPYKLNGSIAYMPCLAALGLMAGWLFTHKHPAAKSLIIASFIFAVSLMFRSVDYVFCASFPIGTHFLWHLLNGCVLYLLTKPIIRVN